MSQEESKHENMAVIQEQHTITHTLNIKQASVVQTTIIPTPPSSPPPQTPRTISELISVRAQLAPDHTILGYPNGKGVDYVEYTYNQLDKYATAGAAHLASSLPLRTTSDAPESVVAVLGPSSLDYFVTVLALSRLGFTVLFLSTRISEAAYISLLTATKCTNICIDLGFRKTISNVQSQVKGLNVIDVLTKDIFQASSTDVIPIQQNLNLSKESSKISWIIHSSGSTGLPKPIYQTHGAALRNYENNMNMEGFITLPLFHAHGLSSVLRGFTSYKKIFMYNASIPLTSQNLLEIGRNYSFEIFYGVPYALKLLSERAEGIEMLAKMKVVMFGGSACPDSLGDLLVEHHINLISHYGTTETGQLMTSFRPVGDKAWNYVRVHEKLQPFARFEERGGGLYELCILDGWPSKVATNREDGSYATKDAFVPHPTIKHAWKYACRFDDTIVLVNGEKAIPIAIEMAVKHNSLVQDAVVFGSGRSRLGMMIVRSQAEPELNDEQVIDSLWKTIEKENNNAAAYEQIAKDTIKVLPAGTPYPQTDKGTLIRQAFYKQFETEISDLYETLETSAPGTMVLDASGLRQYLREQLLELVPGVEVDEIKDNTDLFSLGIDSLQSSRLRHSLLRDLQLNGHILPQNIVFEQPSIEKLANAIITIREGSSVSMTDIEEEMHGLITKYSTFPEHKPMTTTSTSNIVVVTGATGSLGAHVVAQLVKKSEVTEVCCLVRASSQDNATNRVLLSLGDRALLHQLSPKLRQKITAYPSNFSKLDLGLNKDTYSRLQQGVSSVIHCAWSVNFNKRLSSFEADCIAGAKNLMLLCLSAQRPKPASFNFCSSVSTVARTSGAIVEESLPALTSAQGMGYAQSKLVTEHIISRASEQTGMAARVLRVGQIVADQSSGIWNDTEAIPLMLQAATTIGALPTLNERPRWLPVDVVATAVNDISLSNTSKTFFNVVHPNAFSWTNDLLPNLKQAGLKFEKLEQREWIKRLRASNQDVEQNPTYKLLEFFASKYDKELSNTTSSLDYETAAVEAISPALRDCPALTQDLVTKFVRQFLATSWNK